MNKAFLEGYITENTEITIRILYNYQGSQDIRSTTLSGSESAYIVADTMYNALGSAELGTYPLAGINDVPDTINKFRVYLTTPEQPFYEMALEISSDQEGARWEILRFGYDVILKTTEQQSLHKRLS